MTHLNFSWLTLRRSVVCACSLVSLLAMGCGEEVDPSTPSFVEGSLQAQCELESGVSFLSELIFIAEDLDGAETLRSPSVELPSLSLEMEAKVLPVSEEESRCSFESCRVEYTWRFDASTQGRISCGESGEELTATVTISDENGLNSSEQVTSHLE